MHMFLTREAEAGGSLWVWGQPRLHSMMLSQKKSKTKIKQMLKSWEWWHMPYMPGLQSQRGRFGSSQLEEKGKKRQFSVISQQCSSVTSKFSNVTCKKKMKISWSIQDYLVSLSNLMEHFSQNILYNCVHCDEEASSWPVARAWFISESRLVSRQMRLRVWLLPITSWKYLYSSTRPQIFFIYLFPGQQEPQM